MCVGNQPRQASKQPSANHEPTSHHTPHTTQSAASTFPPPASLLCPFQHRRLLPESTSTHKTHVCLAAVRPSAVFPVPLLSVLSARHALRPLRHHWVTWCCVVVHSLAVARGGSLIRGTCPHRIPFTFHTPSHVPLSLHTCSVSHTRVLPRLSNNPNCVDCLDNSSFLHVAQLALNSTADPALITRRILHHQPATIPPLLFYSISGL